MSGLVQPAKPSTPTISIGGGVGTFIVSWQGDESDISVINGYSVYLYNTEDAMGAELQVIVDVENYTLNGSIKLYSTTISNRTVGKIYFATVYAFNGIRTGEYIESEPSESSGNITAIEGGTTVPNPPTGVSLILVEQGTSITITWAPPEINGGSGITLYKIYDSDTDLSIFTAQQGQTEVNINYSINSYTFSRVYMTAINVNGESEHSALSNPITIPGGGGGNVPDAPVITSTTINNDSTVTIIWIVPAQGSEVITGYKIFKVSDDSLVGSTTTETTATFNLASYTPYYIKATNSVGDSLASNASDNFIYAPFLGIPLVESNNITLYFAADTADKLFPTFHIRSNDNSLRYTAAADVGSYTFSNLSSGIYRFYVKAVYTNTTESAEVYTDEISITSVSGPLPATPKILPPVLGNLTITLNWTGAGVGITSYKVTRSDNTGFLYESTVGGSSGTYTINTDLTAGTPITFTVTSVNASGECLVPASIIVSPVSNPEPPAHFVAYVGTVPGTVFLYWIPPSPTSGGTPVTGYVLTYNGITINLGPGVLKFFDNVAPEQGITFSLVSTNKVGSSIPIEAEIFEGGDVTDP